MIVVITIAHPEGANMGKISADAFALGVNLAFADYQMSVSEFGLGQSILNGAQQQWQTLANETKLNPNDPLLFWTNFPYAYSEGVFGLERYYITGNLPADVRPFFVLGSAMGQAEAQFSSPNYSGLSSGPGQLARDALSYVLALVNNGPLTPFAQAYPKDIGQVTGLFSNETVGAQGTLQNARINLTTDIANWSGSS